MRETLERIPVAGSQVDSTPDSMVKCSGDISSVVLSCDPEIVCERNSGELMEATSAVITSWSQGVFDESVPGSCPDSVTGRV